MDRSNGTKDVVERDVPDRGAFMRLLERRRKAKGLTLRQLAHRVGVHTSTAQGWESGRHEPRPNHYQKLSRVLGVDPLELTMLISPEPVSVG